MRSFLKQFSQRFVQVASHRSAAQRRPVRRRLRLEPLEERAVPAVITVTTGNDDITPNDGTVSLREAMTAMNEWSDLGDPDIQAQNPGMFGLDDDEIKFAVRTINVSAALGALPTIADDLLKISSFPFFTLIDGSAFGNGGVAGVAGLTITAASVSIDFLKIENFTGDGIYIKGGGGNNLIAGCRIDDNAGCGIVVDNCGRNTIGGDAAPGVNGISRNGMNGVLIRGAGAIYNDVQNSAIFDNRLYGVQITSGASQNNVGCWLDSDGDLDGWRNNISANALSGVAISRGSNNNQVNSNLIGISSSKNASTVTLTANDGSVTMLGNAGDGIYVAGDNNLIGGSLVGVGAGATLVNNMPELRNVISANWQSGIEIAGGNNNKVYGNYIGTTIAGDDVYDMNGWYTGNQRHGVYIGVVAPGT
jgi:parallel beta-helix repeat protein